MKLVRALSLLLLIVNHDHEVESNNREPLEMRSGGEGEVLRGWRCRSGEEGWDDGIWYIRKGVNCLNTQVSSRIRTSIRYNFDSTQVFLRLHTFLVYPRPPPGKPPNKLIRKLGNSPQQQTPPSLTILINRTLHPTQSPMRQLHPLRLQ